MYILKIFFHVDRYQDPEFVVPGLLVLLVEPPEALVVPAVEELATSRPLAVWHKPEMGNRPRWVEKTHAIDERFRQSAAAIRRVRGLDLAVNLPTRFKPRARLCCIDCVRTPANTMFGSA